MNPRNFSLASGIGGIGAGLGGMLFGGGGDNPYDSASKYFNQIPGKVNPYFQPYQQAGKEALGNLQGEYGKLLGNYGGIQNQYSQLMNDPNSVLGKIGAGYQQSPGYQWQLGQGMNAANNAAAAGGMLGSPQHQQQAATMAEGLANQDYYNYLDKALGLYGTGLGGAQGLYGMGLQGQQGINQMGYGANDQLASIIANALAQQGGLSYQGQLAQNQNKGTQWGDLIGGAAALASFF